LTDPKKSRFLTVNNILEEEEADKAIAQDDYERELRESTEGEWVQTLTPAPQGRPYQNAATPNSRLRTSGPNQRAPSTRPKSATSNFIIRCYNCNELGHFAKDCTNEAVCKNCKRKGHLVKDCTSEMMCYNCNTKGHYAKDCLKSKSRATTPYPKAASKPTYQTSVATLRRRKTERRFANGARINGIDYDQVMDHLDGVKILDEEDFSGIPDGFDQGDCEDAVEEGNRSGSEDGENESDEEELVSALSKFMSKDRSKLKKGSKTAKKERSGVTYKSNALFLENRGQEGEIPNFTACLDKQKCQWNIDSGSEVNVVSAKYILNNLPDTLSPESNNHLAPCFDEVSDFKGNTARGIAYVQLYFRILNGLPSFSLQKEDNDVALSVMVVDAQFESFILGTPFFRLVNVHIQFPTGARPESVID
jgi:hypothetical protein